MIRVYRTRRYCLGFSLDIVLNATDSTSQTTSKTVTVYHDESAR